MNQRAKHSQADLSDYLEQPHLSRHWGPEVNYSKEALEEAEQDFALGINLQDALAHRDTPIRILLSQAAREACEATRALLHADLYTDDGIAQARLIQAQAMRYRELINWIDEKLAEAGDAAELLHDYQEAAGELPPEPGPHAGPGDED